MPASIIAVFSQPNAFEAALQPRGGLALLVTGRGQFRAQLIRVALPHLCLLQGDERLSRIAVVTVAPGSVLVILPMDREPPQTCGGASLLAGEMMTVSAGERLHVRTDGPSHWAAICLSAKALARHGHALVGRKFVLPSGIRRWRPPRASLRSLMALFNGAMRLTEAQPGRPIETEAARGLEQQMICALIGCLSIKGLQAHEKTTHRRAAIMARLEDVLPTHLHRIPRVAEVCAALHLSERTLQACCRAHVGVAASRYFHLCAMRLVHNALTGAYPAPASVSQIAKCHGFNHLGRFARIYRRQFGELPSTTLGRDAG